MEHIIRRDRDLNAINSFICCIKIEMNALNLIVLFGGSNAFIDPQTAEKLFVQTLGVVRFATQTELRRPLYQDITFNLYTKRNPRNEIKLYVNDRQRLLNSTLNLNSPIVIVIHGYTDHKDRILIARIRDALVQHTNANVIVLDWKPLAALIYFNAAASSITVGYYLKEFLAFLEECGISLKSVHLVGHSLGGQISGVAGGAIGGHVGRITALDPAGPLFEFVYERNTTESLDPSDALFVDVIHTAGTTFGVMKPVGHADFYPNHGTAPQPVSCSHIRAVDYFIESVAGGPKQFLAKKCLEFRHNILTNCSIQELIPMGYYTPTSARGNFYLQTNEEPPYAMGNKFYKTLI